MSAGLWIFFEKPKGKWNSKDNNNWIVKTNKNQVFSAPNIIIAGGVGSFEPRNISLKDAEKYEGKSVFYSVNDKN